MTIQQRVLEMLRNWSSDVVAEGNFFEVFTFGSLVYKDGEQFSEDLSDIDLIAVFSPHLQRAPQRVSACVSLLPLLELLEIRLLRLLQRKAANKPVVSLVAPTTDELHFGIHKDGKPGFFNTNDFAPLTQARSSTFGARRNEVAEPIWDRLLAVIQEVQKFRNAFLRVSANGSRELTEWDSTTDLLPKQMCRTAAQLRHFVENRSDSSQYDVNLGYAFITQLLYAKADQDSSVRDIHQLLLARQGGRGPRIGVRAESALLLWETLFDTAIQLLPREQTSDSNQVSDGATNSSQRTPSRKAQSRTQSRSKTAPPTKNFPSTLELLPYTRQSFITFVENFSGSSTFSRTTEILYNLGGVLSDNAVKSILIETEYQDLDFLDSARSVYLEALNPISLGCKRLHFFSQEFDNQRLAEIVRLSAEQRSSLSVSQILQSNYVGFAVLRPIPNAPIGTSVITPPRVNEANFVTTRCEVRLLGIDLHVQGLPYMQADPAIGSGADTGVWMMLAQLQGSDHTKTTSYLASRLNPSRAGNRSAREGRSIEGMQQILTEEGFDPSFIRVEQDPEAFLYNLGVGIRSNIPVLLLAEGSGYWTCHMLAGYDKQRQDNQATYNGITLEGETANAPYVHSDLFGPYTRATLSIEPTKDALRLEIKRKNAVNRERVVGALFCYSRKVRTDIQELLITASRYQPLINTVITNDDNAVGIETSILTRHQYFSNLYTTGFKTEKVLELLRTRLSEYVGIIRWYVDGLPKFDLILDCTSPSTTRTGLPTAIAVVTIDPGFDDHVSQLAAYWGARKL